MSSEIDQGLIGANDILRFKHSLGVASGATVPALGSFIYITGIWADDDGDLVADPGESLCQSMYSGSLSLVAP